MVCRAVNDGSCFGGCGQSLQWSTVALELNKKEDGFMVFSLSGFIAVDDDMVVVSQVLKDGDEMRQSQSIKRRRSQGRSMGTTAPLHFGRLVNHSGSLGLAPTSGGTDGAKDDAFGCWARGRHG